MKIKLSIVTVLAAMISVSSAANYYVNNVVAGDTTDVLLQNSVPDGGTLSSGGIIAIGYFTAGLPSTSLVDIDLIVAGFTSEAFVLSGTNSVDLGGSFAGYFQSDIIAGGTITGLDSRIGLGVYLFAGNAATLATSTGFALMQVGTIADDVPFNQQYTADPAIGVIVGDIGTLGLFTGDSGVAVGTFTTLQLSVIPEPSVALLGAFGILGLLRRRR